MQRSLYPLAIVALLAACTPAQDAADLASQSPSGTDWGAAAIDLVASSPRSPLTNAQNELRVRSVETDSLGITHVRLDQIYQTLPVLGGEAIAHLPGDGSAATVTLSLHPTPANLHIDQQNNAQNSVNAARRAAAEALGGVTDNCASCPATLAVFVAPASAERNSVVAPRLAYQIEASTNAINGSRFLIDAKTQQVLQRTPLAMSQNP